ncbi:MAG: PKD domain-containing protein [Bacteroidota bacterium]
MKNLKLFFSLLAFLSFFESSAQVNLTLKSVPPDEAKLSDWECGSMLLLKNNMASTPLTGQFPQQNGNAKTQSVLYQIPVVFHVISDPGNPTPIPSYAQVQMQLASLNAAFSNNLGSLNNVTVGPRAFDTQIQFCLAKSKQVNGNPTAWPTSSVGVVYYSINNSLTTNININSNPSLATLAALTNANFPPSMYLNIWCVPNIATSAATNVNAPPTVIGIGTFPWMTAPIDGIVMRNDVIGNNTYNNFTGNMFSTLDKGNILAHEAGHYLGLLHTFETVVGGNMATAGGAPGCYGLTNQTTEGDLIFDTPPTMINGSLPPGTYNTCNETYSPYGLSNGADVNDQLENFMSYSDDDHMNTFTNGQAQRMKGALDALFPSAFLTGQRANLTLTPNLIATGVNTTPSCGPALLTANFSASLVLASITCTTAAVQFYQPILPGYLSATSYTWNFGDGNTSNLPNPSHTYITPPTNFIVTLTVSDGVSTSSSTLAIYTPTGTPQIAGFSGQSHVVCRGTEQTILIQFPAYLLNAIITDGTNYYPVTTNFVHNNSTVNGIYQYPFTFTITGNTTFSVVTNCGNGGPVASFTVVDCCSNLITNGDLENGPVSFTSQYNLNTFNTFGGSGAINYPALTSYPAFGNNFHNTGKSLIIDSSPGYSGCGLIGSSRLILGQAFTGLKPSTDYYVAVKLGQSADSVLSPGCPNKFNMKLFNATTSVLTRTFITSTVPPIAWTIAGGTNRGSAQVVNFIATTPATINAATAFTFQLFEIENSSGYGFDYSFDNIIVSEMNAPILISPLTASICPGGSVALNATGNCVPINNYSLVWQPSAGLSCSTCANPVASPSVTTNYTLLAIPPISTPPQPNLAFTTLVNVSLPLFTISSNTSCSTGGYTLVANGVPSVTWQPPGITSSAIVVSPSVVTTYTANYTGAGGCATQNYITVTPSAPVVLLVGGNPVYCAGGPPAVINAAVSPPGSTPTFTWLPGNMSGAIQNVTPATPTTYTVNGTVNGCQIGPATFSVNPISASIAVGGNSVYCKNIGPAIVTATSYPTGYLATYTWLPGNFSGASQSLTPLLNTTFTIQAVVGGCAAPTVTFAVKMYVNCGTSIGVNGEEEFPMITLFPNPTTGKIQFISQQKNERLNVKMFDIGAKIIFDGVVIISDYTGHININVAEGIYLAEIANSSDQRMFKKIIVVK